MQDAVATNTATGDLELCPELYKSGLSLLWQQLTYRSCYGGWVDLLFRSVLHSCVSAYPTVAG